VKAGGVLPSMTGLPAARHDLGLGGRSLVTLSGPSLVILAAGRARRYGAVEAVSTHCSTARALSDLLASRRVGLGL